MRKKGVKKEADSLNKDKKHKEPKSPKHFISSNQLVILVIGVLSKGYEPTHRHIFEEDGETMLINVPF